MRPLMFKFTPSEDVFDLCLRALLHSSKRHQAFLRSEGLVGEDDFKELHNRMSETWLSTPDGPMEFTLHLSDALNLSVALRAFIPAELPEKHHLANEGWMLEGALGDFMGTALAMPSKAEPNMKTLEQLPPTEEEAWTAKRDAIFRDIFVPKSRLNIWGKEVPVEAEEKPVNNCGNCNGKGKLLRGQWATEATECPQCANGRNETRQVAVYFQGKKMEAAEAAEVLKSPHVQHLMGGEFQVQKDGTVNVQVPKAADFIQINFKVGPNGSLNTDPNDDLLDGADPASFNERMKVEGNMAEHVKARRKAGQVAALQDAYGGNPCKEIQLKDEDIQRSGASDNVPLFYSVFS